MAITPEQQRLSSFVSSVRGNEELSKETNPYIVDLTMPETSMEEVSSSIDYLQERPKTQENIIPTVSTNLRGSYTLDELENDNQFQTVAERFMESTGTNEDIFEYLRDADWSLSSALYRAGQIGNWSPQAKQDYTYLKGMFDKAEIGGLKQGLRAFKDLSIDLIADPFNLLAVAAAPVTFGSSLAAQASIAEMAKYGLKKGMAGKITKEALKGAKDPAIFTALEGAAWAGPHDFFLQKGEKELGMRDSINIGQTAAVTALGGVFGGIVGTGLGTMTAISPLVFRKQYGISGGRGNGVSNEIRIKDEAENLTSSEYRKEVNDAYVNEQVTNIDAEDRTLTGNQEIKNKNLKKFLKAVSLTTGKTTTRFIKLAEESETLSKLLGAFRYDWYRRIGDPERKLEVDSFGLALAKLKGGWQEKLETALEGLDEEATGWFGFGKQITANHNEQLLRRLQNENAVVDPAVERSAALLRELQDDIFAKLSLSGKYSNEGIQLDAQGNKISKERKNDFGIIFNALIVPEAKRKNYFTRKLQHDLVDNNRDVLKSLLKRFGRDVEGKLELGSKESYASVRNYFDEKKLEDFINEFGEVQKGMSLQDYDAKKTIDMNTFSRNFLDEAKKQFNTARDKQKFLAQARELNPNESNDFITKAAINLYADDLKADAIINRIVDMPYKPFDTFESSKAKKGGAAGYLKQRIFANIPDEYMNQFIDTRVEDVFNEYILDAAMLSSREKYFGRNLGVFRDRYVNPIRAELGVGPESKEAIEHLETMYQRITGLDVPDLGKAKGLVANLKLSQQLAHLPLATLSSLTEPLILLTRVDAKDTPQVFKDIGSALYSETRKTMKKVSKAYERKTKGTAKRERIDDDVWKEAYQVGLALEQAVSDRLAGLYGDVGVNNRASKIARGFFKANLLTQWTSAVQLASFTTGKRLILDRIEGLAKGGLDDITKKRHIDQLAELGVDYKEGVQFYNRNLKNNKFNISAAYKDSFYQNEYLGGANRFAREIILNPDITEANKPLWFAHPATNILVQFAGYPTVFNNTVLKRMGSEIHRDFADGKIMGSPQIIGATTLMTASAMLTNALRSGGKSLEEGEGKALLEAVERWGGLGPAHYGYRFYQNAKLGGGQAGALLKAPTGPIAQDVIDSILYRKGITEILATNVPLYSLLPFEARKSLKGVGRDIDKALFSPFAPTKKPRVTKKPTMFKTEGLRPFAKGGVVDMDENLESYNYLTTGVRKLAPIFEDRRPTTKYTEKELKNYAKGITVPVYRYLPVDTRRKDLEQLRNSENIGIKVNTKKIRKGVEGFVRLNNPLDLRELNITSIKGHDFVKQIDTDQKLKNKIISESILSDNKAKEYIDDLLMKHDLANKVANESSNIENINKILNVKASHELRDTLYDIGYDSILYNDPQRQELFAGGLSSKAAKAILLRSGQFKPITKINQELLDFIDNLKNKIENDPETLYIYADTEARLADDGVEQYVSATAARGLPNALGIAVKRRSPKITNKKYNTEKIYYEDKIRNKTVIESNLKEPKNDIKKIIEAYVDGGYKKLVISKQLKEAIDTASPANSKAPITIGLLRKFIASLEKWSKTGPAPENLNAGYMQVLGPSFVPTRQVDPYYKTKEATSKVALPNVVMDRPRVRTQPMETTKVLEPEEIDFRTKEKVKQLEEELNDPAVRAALPANKFRSFQEEIFDPDPELVYAEQALEEIDRLKAKDYLEPYERMGDITPKSQVDLLYDQYERLLDEGRGTEADELMDRIRRLEGN